MSTLVRLINGLSVGGEIGLWSDSVTFSPFFGKPARWCNVIHDMMGEQSKAM